MEPAASDEEILPQGEPVEIDIEHAPRPATKKQVPPPKSQVFQEARGETPVAEAEITGTRSLERRSSRPLFSSENTPAGAGDFSLQARMALSSQGFGGVLKLVQYPKSWLGVTETFRYFKNEDEDRLFINRKGVLVGVEVHPYRSVFISPFLDIQGGWEMFERPETFDDEKSPVFEGALGLELRLTSFATLVGQWTEAYYPDLKTQMFFPGEKKDPKRYQTAEVLFNIKWEKKMF